MTSTLLRDVRPWGRPATDVLLTDGRIAAVGTDAIGPDTSADPGVAVVEGHGRLVVPSFAAVHDHLDSTRLGLPFRPHTAEPGLQGLISNDRAHWREDPWTVAERATHTLGELVRHGATRVSAYAQVDTDAGLERFEGVLAAREAHRDRADVRVMAFPQSGIVADPGTRDLLDVALRAGADVVGGIDPCGLDRDPRGHLDAVFGLAEKHRVPVDIHLHERGELGAFSLDLVLERVRALGMQGQVTVAHAFVLASLPTERVHELVDELAAADVAVTTVAPSGGVLPLVRLAEAGVRVGLGQDGTRDFWSPYGDGDMLRRTWQLAFTNGFRRDALIEHCVAVATVGGRSVVDPAAHRLTGVDDRPGLDVGDVADLVVLAGDTVTAAVMDVLPDRTVLHAGRVVADGLALV